MLGTGTKAAAKGRKGDAENISQEPLSQRSAFAEEVERLHSDAVGAELRADSLARPPARVMSQTLDMLYDSSMASLLRGQPVRKRWFQICCSRKIPKQFGEETEWAKVFGDLDGNVMTGDFLRDDGFSLVTAEDFVFFRLLPLIHFFNARARSLSFWVHLVQGMSFLLTGLLTAVVAIGLERWAPLIVTLMAAIASAEELEHFSGRLRHVNQSLEVLKNLHFWWQSLSMIERRQLINKETLVSGTEATVDAEVSTWKRCLRGARVPSKMQGGRQA